VFRYKRAGVSPGSVVTKNKRGRKGKVVDSQNMEREKKESGSWRDVSDRKVEKTSS